MKPIVERARIDQLIIANHVEAINGLLYISGGGWTDHNRPRAPGAPPLISHLGIALGLVIPWAQIDRPHQVTIDIEAVDGGAKLMHADAQIAFDSATMAHPGRDQPTMLGLGVDVVFPEEKEYRVVVHLNGDADARQWNFHVHDAPLPKTG